MTAFRGVIDGAPGLVAVRMACLAVATICVLAVGAVGWARPQLNWDMLAYVGLVRGWHGDDATARHRAAFEEVDDVAAARGLHGRAAELRRGTYRAAVAGDPDTFAEQLPFYRIRPFYLTVLSVLSRWAGSVAEAAVLTSALSVVLCGLGLLWFAARALGAVAGSVVTVLFVLVPAVSDTAVLATPDALAMLVAGAGAVLFLGGRPLAASLVLLAGVLVRTDLQVLDVCLALGAALLAGTLRPALVLLLSVPLVAAVNAWAGSYGYAVLYRFSFVDHFVPHPAALAGMGIPLDAFARAFVFGLWYSLGNGGLWPALALLVLCGALLRSWRTPEGALLLAVGLATAIRFVLFPSHDLRMNAVPTAMLTVLLVRLAASRHLLPPSWSAAPPAGRAASSA